MVVTISFTDKKYDEIKSYGINIKETVLRECSKRSIWTSEGEADKRFWKIIDDVLNTS